MKFRGLDANGDFMFGQGVGSYAVNAAALALDIKARLQSWLGDCFFSRSSGVDYHNRLDKGQEKNLIADLTNTIMQTSGVVKVLSIASKLDPKTRALTVTYRVQTIYSSDFTGTVSGIAGAVAAGG